MFSAALSDGQQQTGETSFHPDSENTDSEKRNLHETEFAEKKDQAMEYYKTQMRNKIQMDEQQTTQQIAGECSVCASTLVFRVQDSRKRFT